MDKTSMDKPDTNNESQPAMAVKKTSDKTGFSPIWIVPIVALLIGAFLLYRLASQSGPTITITFKEGSGLEAGKTQIKYKDVTVGDVTDVELSDDVAAVIVTAEMHPGAKSYLTEKSRFWVVKPQFSGGSISGLGTLLSGNYIAMDGSTEGTKIHAFTGLERPPVIHSTDPGSHFTLHAKTLGSANFGSPIYFKRIPVGQVVEYSLRDNGELKVEIFIKAPYDKHVNSATRFWDASGLDVTLNANGLEVHTESLISIVAGGIAFDTVALLGQDASQPVAKGQEFTLYSSRSSSRKLTYKTKRRAMLYFDDNVRGLLPGAPVEMRGFQIGQVLDVGMEFDRETTTFKLPVLIEIEPDRAQISGDETFEGIVNALVARGWRAQLKMGNLVLGKLLVELDFHPDAPPAKADFSGKYPTIPTIPGAFTEIVRNAGALIAELRETGKTINTLLQSEDTRQGLKDLATTIANVKRLTGDLEKTTMPELASVLQGASATLEETQTMLATNSSTRTEINRLLAELAEAARSIRLLADYLEQNPESIIKGKD
jgi:paraquat-inducible protein B